MGIPWVEAGVEALSSICLGWHNIAVSVTANLRDTPVSRNMIRLVHDDVVAGTMFMLLKA
jgi:hypothetical protein